MNPFLFEYEMYWPGSPIKYMLVYAKDVESAFVQIHARLNPTQATYAIRLATIGLIIESKQTT